VPTTSPTAPVPTTSPSTPAEQPSATPSAGVGGVNETRPPSAGPGSTVDNGGLPVTGTKLAGIVSAGLLLLFGGAALVLFGRRARTRATHAV
jgi:hypothetical protein